MTRKSASARRFSSTARPTRDPTAVLARRRRFAYEAARIMVEEDSPNFERARRKAAARLGVTDKRSWPDNAEIHEMLLEQRRLFDAVRARDLNTLRACALAAMTTLRAFAPRLVGAALAGTATLSQGVRLHLFADTPEEVLRTLFDRGIPWSEHEECLRYADGTRRNHPALRFVAGDIPVELMLLPLQARRHPPLDAVTERPERGAGIDAVRRLLDPAASR